MKRAATVVLISLVALAATACNTIRGAGQDLQRAGQEIQDAAD